MVYAIIALGAALAMAALTVWVRTRRTTPKGREAQCRRDIQALRRTSRSQGAAHAVTDIWSAGADPDSAPSRAKKSVSWVAIGTVGGCGGCGGCGCGG
jgi:hypothetical protein